VPSEAWVRAELSNWGRKLDEASSFLPYELTLLSEVHIEVHTELPNTLILPDYGHLR